jgi:hypothetical protein
LDAVDVQLVPMAQRKHGALEQLKPTNRRLHAAVHSLKASMKPRKKK